MKAVYIAHELSASTLAKMNANRDRAARWVAWAARQGVCPMATWITMSGEMDETPENRALGLALDVEQVSRCDEFWACGKRWSSGMRFESAGATTIIEHFTDDGEPPSTVSPEERCEYCGEIECDDPDECDRRLDGPDNQRDLGPHDC